MRNFKIGKKLIVTFGVIIILFCITVIVSITSLQTTGGNFQFFYDNGYQIMNQTMEMRHAIQSASKNIGYATMVSDQASTDKYIAACQSDLDSMEKRMNYLYENFEGDMTLVDNFNATLTSGVEAKEKVIEYCRKLDNVNASKTFFDDYMPVLLEATDILNQITNVASKSADDSFSQSKQTLVITNIFLIILSLIALIVTILLALYVTKSLTKPIKEIEFAANKIALGDLNVQIDYESDDELGQLSNSMRQMTGMFKGIIEDIGFSLAAMGDGDFTVDSKVSELYVGSFKQLLDSIHTIIDRLSSVLLQIGQSSDQVSSGSDQVSSGAQALSQGATEQASSVEELAATINDVSYQIKLNASSATDANALAAQTGEELVRSNNKMKNMIEAMTEISSSSNEIGKIIKTIEDIAFQTNILALNAAVEAARAGAAGKGFAVVADEVRNLASKSAEASKSTSALIENSLHAVENGTRIVNETAESLIKAVEGAKLVSENINKISDASTEQAQSITQITLGMDQISSVVQTNSATAEESAAASEELSSQAQILRDLVGQFKLKEMGINISQPQTKRESKYSKIQNNDDFTFDQGKY